MQYCCKLGLVWVLCTRLKEEMSPLQQNTKSIRHSMWSACLTFALVIVYLLGAFQSTSIHHFVHGESVELHSETNELDACHQAIYHHSQECGHKLHLSKSEQCSLCHLVFHSESFLPENSFSLGSDNRVVVVSSCYSFIVDGTVSNLSARAPPLA